MSQEPPLDGAVVPLWGREGAKLGGGGVRCALGSLGQSRPSRPRKVTPTGGVESRMPSPRHLSWKERTGTGGQRGHRTGPVATRQLEPIGQLLATLLWNVICKGKVLRGIWRFPKQLPVRGLTPHSGGRYRVRGGIWRGVLPRKSRAQTSDPLVFAPDDQALGHGIGHCPRPWHPPPSPQTWPRPHMPGDRGGSGRGHPVSLAVKLRGWQISKAGRFFQDRGSGPGGLGTCD